MKEKKKILFVSTYEESGGAAIACKRTFNALKKSDEFEVKMLVLFKDTDDENVFELFENKFLKKVKQRLYLAVEQLYMRPKINSKKLYFQYSTGFFGYNIANHPLVEWADIINIHWIHQGFLSLSSINKLCNKEKSVYWTMHDMWAYSRGEHYVGDNNSYQNEKGYSEFLKKRDPNDLSNKIWNRKEKLLKNNKNLRFIGPSTWMQKCCQSSYLFKDHICELIPYPYEPLKVDFTKKEGSKINVLYGAASMLDERKGYKYFVDAVNLLEQKDKDKIKLLLFGKGNDEQLSLLKNIEFNHVGFLNQPELVKLYAESDILIMPTLEDNLPNTVIESMAYKNAILGFDTGGMSDMISNEKNGFLSDVKDAKTLSQNLSKLINTPQLLDEFQKESQKMREDKFSVSNVISQYKKLN